MTQRLTSQEMSDELSKLIYGKHVWLENFSGGRNKRPDHDIERVSRELNVLNQAASDYRRAKERERGAA